MEYPKLILSDDTDEHLPRLSGGYRSSGSGDDLGPRILWVAERPGRLHAIATGYDTGIAHRR